MVGMRGAIGKKHKQVWRENCQHQHHFSSDLFRDKLSIWLKVSQLFPEGHLLADSTPDQTDNRQACGNFVLAASGCHPQVRHTGHPEKGQFLRHLEKGQLLSHHPHSHRLLCSSGTILVFQMRNLPCRLESLNPCSSADGVVWGGCEPLRSRSLARSG